MRRRNNGGGGGYNGGDSFSPGSSSLPGGAGGSFTRELPTSAQDGVQTGNGEVSLCYTPPPIPTLTEWAMIGLTGLLALCGVAVMERRRRFVA